MTDPCGGTGKQEVMAQTTVLPTEWESMDYDPEKCAVGIVLGDREHQCKKLPKHPGPHNTIVRTIATLGHIKTETEAMAWWV